MSIDIRLTASRLPSATATTSTITVSGRLMAKTIGFMSSVRSGKGAGQSAVPADSATVRSGQSGQSAFGSKFMMREAGWLGIWGRR